MQTADRRLSAATRSSIQERTASIAEMIGSGSVPSRTASSCLMRSLIPSTPFSLTESTNANSRPICWSSFLALAMMAKRSVLIDVGDLCGRRKKPPAGRMGRNVAEIKPASGGQIADRHLPQGERPPAGTPALLQITRLHQSAEERTSEITVRQIFPGNVFKSSLRHSPTPAG